MILGWLKRRRRRRLLARPTDERWVAWLEALPFHAHLSDEAQGRLLEITRVLVAEKHWEGCGGLDLTDEMIVMMAAQASLLLLEIEHDHYRDLRSIFVYPSAYRTPVERRNADGTYGAGSVNLGEAWYRGPVVLAWDAVRRGWSHARDGRNVVLHEFAHQLDYLDGAADGTPPGAGVTGTWKHEMTARYRELVAAAQEHRLTLLDKYGATNPAEFFAVCTECFFERGPQLRRRHAELYDVLRGYYRQDPAAWGRAP